MGYRNLAECVRDLETTKQLVRIDCEIDARLEAGLIQRRVCEARGPALMFTRVKGCRFPMLANLFGTTERCEYLFRDAIEAIKLIVRLSIDPAELMKHPWRHRGLPFSLWRFLPRFVRSGPIMENRTTIGALPQLVSWPNDGGAFVTLPQVYTEDPDRPGIKGSNLGMYRIQLSGGEYNPDLEVGLHYQIHRGIGVHHAAALRRGENLRVNVLVGGPPALAVAAVMPLPEGMPEAAFAGLLGGRRISWVRRPGALPIPAEVDFCICGTVDPNQRKPEGPFGDHLGYYSLAHDFPVLKVDEVWHRPGAIWPFTTVGRPPQEDTTFGEFIHELTGPLIPKVVHGVHAVHAVDAAGVHPLLLAIGSERYVPYAERRAPQELLTCANAILGQGQLSLAKYLFIIATEDALDLDIHDIPAFFRHVLERVDWRRDLHFQTRTTIDTLDYSGTGFNEGSKLVVAAVGPTRRSLPTEIPADLTLPPPLRDPKICLPGVLAVSAPPYSKPISAGPSDLEAALRSISPGHPINGFPLVVVVDDSEFTAKTLNNFLWVTFTRSNPAADIDGIGASVEQKHWGCDGALFIDARRKPHHAPPLEDDPEVVRKVESLAARGGPLHGLIPS